jgi:hypothetical protein
VLLPPPDPGLTTPGHPHPLAVQVKKVSKLIPEESCPFVGESLRQVGVAGTSCSGVCRSCISE